MRKKSGPKYFATAHNNVFTANNFENYDLKAQNPLYGLIFLMSFACHLDVICMRSYLSLCTLMSPVCHSFVLVYHPYVPRMYSYTIHMSLVCTRVPSVCHSYVRVCHPYFYRMYPYVTRMSSVCHSYVLVCHLYVTRMWLYNEPLP